MNLNKKVEAANLLLQACTGKLELERPDVSKDMHHVVQLLREQGRSWQVEIMLKYALAQMEERFGSGSSLVREVSKDLVRVLLDQKKYQEAEKIQRDSLFKVQDKVGKLDSDTKEDERVLGAILALEGSYYTAEKTLVAALDLKDDAFENETSTSRRTMIRLLANLILSETGQGEMYQRTQKGKEKARDPDHTSTLDTVNNLGNLYADQGEPDENERMYQQALKGKEKVWDPDHKSTLDTVNNLGNPYADQDELELFNIEVEMASLLHGLSDEDLRSFAKLQEDPANDEQIELYIYTCFLIFTRTRSPASLEQAIVRTEGWIEVIAVDHPDRARRIQILDMMSAQMIAQGYLQPASAPHPTLQHAPQSIPQNQNFGYSLSQDQNQSDSQRPAPSGSNTLPVTDSSPLDEIGRQLTQPASSSTESTRYRIAIELLPLCPVCYNLNPYRAPPDGSWSRTPWAKQEYNIPDETPVGKVKIEKSEQLLEAAKGCVYCAMVAQALTLVHPGWETDKSFIHIFLAAGLPVVVRLEFGTTSTLTDLGKAPWLAAGIVLPEGEDMNFMISVHDPSKPPIEVEIYRPVIPDNNQLIVGGTSFSSKRNKVDMRQSLTVISRC